MSYEILCVDPTSGKFYLLSEERRLIDSITKLDRLNSRRAPVRNEDICIEDLKRKYCLYTGREYGTIYDGKMYVQLTMNSPVLTEISMGDTIEITGDLDY